jgi:branched-chain amino acid aminotransferase
MNMGENIVYLDGEYVKWSEAKVSIHDRGFMWGDSVYEHSRTFNGQPFMWKEHIARLFRSLRYIGLDIDLTEEQIYDISLEVLRRNENNLSPDGTLVHRISRGIQWEDVTTPYTVVIDCLPMEKLISGIAKFYVEGARVITATTRRTPPQCLDARAKLCNKLNHIMAERQVKAFDPQAYALMLDISGFLSECSAQNIFIVKDGRLFTPKDYNILEGITRALLRDKLARELKIDYVETDLTLYDAYNADEMFLAATSFTILPVSRLDNRPVGESIPGLVTKRLTDAWSEMVGINIVEQALNYARRTLAT